MCSYNSSSLGRSSIKIGSIVITSGSSNPVDSLYLQWMNSAVSARSFNERFWASGREYTVSGCRLAAGQQEKGRVSMVILVDILDLGPNGDRKERSLTDALDPIILWMERALATLIENASVGEQEADAPALLEIIYCPSVSELTAEVDEESGL